MSSDRIHSNIQALFAHPQHWPGITPKVVFWVDPEAEFAQTFAELHWEGVAKYTLTGRNHWQLKQVLHQAGPDDCLLIYQGFPEPPLAQDWLLDARLYGQRFSAQRAQMLYLELQLDNPELRPLIAEHVRFFEAQERVQKLQALGPDPRSSPHAFLGHLIAVVLNHRQVDAFRLVRELLSAGDTADHNPVWQKLTKFFAPALLWAYLQRELGLPEAPHSLRHLATRLALTHMAYQFQGKLPPHWQALKIEPPAQPFRFVDSWLHDQRDSDAWYALANALAQELHLDAVLADLPPEAYLDCETFHAFDQALLTQALAFLREPQPDYGRLRKYILRRQELLSARPFGLHYAAVTAAARLFEAQAQLSAPDVPTLDALLKAYVAHHWQIDQAYRHYWQALDAMPTLEADALRECFHALSERVEGAYQQALHWLGEHWSNAVSELSAWPPPQLPQHSDFFAEVVWPRTHQGDQRLVVIISDALRYEVAQELRQRLQTETTGQVQLDARLSPLPSRTSYGMAALLPRPQGQSLALTAAGQPRIAGQSTEGLEQRQKILSAHARMPACALHYHEVMAMNRAEGREWVKGFQLAYIYHDQIDATGDKPANQDKVFEACAQTVETLVQLVKRLTHMNISQIVITADHGFLYQRQEREDYDKLDIPPGDKILRKHRSLLGTQPDQAPGVISLPLAAYDTETPLYLSLPRGTLRFRLQGGSTRYMHGGAMPQEICAPVLLYQHVKASLNATRPKTGVQVLATHRRITNAHFAVQLLQSEPVGEQVRPRQVLVFFENDQGQALTPKQRLTLQSTAEHAPEREQRVLMTLTHPDLPPRALVYLRVYDEEDQRDVLPPQEWQLNLSFRNEFGF